MTADARRWRASIDVFLPTRLAADRLARVLTPEAAREVPRSQATLGRTTPRTVQIMVRAEDTGALRAAMNAHLGWVRLALESESVATAAARMPIDPGGVR